MRPKRPLRSVWLGSQRYLSVYGLGVAQAMGLLGHWHRPVSFYDSREDVVRQVAEMQPDVIWTHMALWPPAGSIGAEAIADILSHWLARGSCVFLHDGDPRERDLPSDLGKIFSIALVNRRVGDVQYASLPVLRWPYGAMVQREIGEPVDAWRCDLLFAGHMRGDGLYGERTMLVDSLLKTLGDRMRVICPGFGHVNNRMLVADAAPSAGAVLGFGRPEVPGWTDTRIVQWTGAGGVLVHDDASEFLVPDEHYLRYERGAQVWQTMESVLRCVERAKTEGLTIRERAFRHVQAHHTWVHRVEDALAAFYGR